mgnify:CR=1 FL=1
MGVSELGQRKDMFLIDPDKLVEAPGWNVRKPGKELDAHIRWLADSIKEKGVQEPLTIWMDDGRPTITNGHCRLLAVKLARKEGAEIKAVPVRIEDRYGNEGDRILSMITRNSGKPLSPLETSEVLKRLVAYGWTEEEVAKKTGYGIGQTKNLLMLSSLPRELTKPIENGQVSASLVVEQVRKRGQDGARQALDEAIKTAEGKGKPRATRKHLDGPGPVSWGIWGPKLHSALKKICETPINDVQGPISEAIGILDSMEGER